MQLARFGLALGLAALAAGCNDDYRSGSARHYVPLSPELVGLMAEKNMHKHDPILIRSFKKESELEVWKKGRDGKYALLKTYPICRWSGQLGPKVREGDRQAPEGFYPISPRQMNPNSSYYLSFDMGYPNTYDRALGRSGSFLMVHGACSSRGCYSMTDDQIKEIYALVREAHSGGQPAVQMQALPFRMTAENLAKHRRDPYAGFWKMLKEGNDYFEVTREEPKVAVCGARYTFGAKAGEGSDCAPAQVGDDVRKLIAEKQRNDEIAVAELVAKGTPAVKVVYADGGQHPSFKFSRFAYAGGSGQEDRLLTAVPPAGQKPAFAEVSRPEALEEGPREIALGSDGKPVQPGKAKPAPAVQVAAKPAPAGPAPAAVAVAKPPAEPVTAVAKVEKPAEELPFYKKIFSVFSSEKPVEAAADSATLPQLAPLPPARGAARPQARLLGDKAKTSALPGLPGDAVGRESVVR